MLYKVTLWVPMVHERGLEVKQEFICGSRKEARLWASKAMPVAYETYYSARVGRFMSVDIQPVKRFRSWATPKAEYRECLGRKETIEQPIEYVPSVGDLGWAP